MTYVMTLSTRIEICKKYSSRKFQNSDPVNLIFRAISILSISIQESHSKTTEYF